MGFNNFLRVMAIFRLPSPASQISSPALESDFMNWHADLYGLYHMVMPYTIYHIPSLWFIPYLEWLWFDWINGGQYKRLEKGRE